MRDWGLPRRLITGRWLLHDDRGDLGGLRRRAYWESGRRRRRGGGGRGGRGTSRFNRGRGGVAEKREAEHRGSDGCGHRRKAEQHKRAAPRRLVVVLPLLAAELHLGSGVGRVLAMGAVGQYVLDGIVFGPGEGLLGGH